MVTVPAEADVVVAGAGNAGLVAALAAHEAGARVIVLEAAGRDERGGNSRFSGGIFRTVHDGMASLEPLLHASSRRWQSRVDLGPYRVADYVRDWTVTSAGRASPAMIHTVVEKSFETLAWMHERGVEWELTVDKLFDPDKLDPSVPYALPPGGAVRARGEGQGLVQRLFRAVEGAGIDVWYEAPCAGLVTSGSTVDGVRIRRRERTEELGGVVVLACGGFESNPEMRLRYLGPGWDLVKVRGTRFNMGTMLTQALLAGAQPAGHWGGAHAAPIDADAPPVGDLRLTDKMSRYSYPYSLLVNRRGERFVDEGEDEVWLTYAKTGWAIRAEDQGVAYQIFDAATIHLLEPRYATGSPVTAETIADLATALGLPPDTLTATVDAFNASVAADADQRFAPFRRDGVRAAPPGQPPKSNWARRVERPPFVAYAVTCGITFTYGGLKVSTEAEVLDTEGRPMPGLFATGEIAGDFFFHNYAAGSGLMRGAVFGRIAGASAARLAAGRSGGRGAVAMPVRAVRP
jgi:tricarballylate dehydrogenase